MRHEPHQSNNPSDPRSNANPTPITELSFLLETAPTVPVCCLFLSTGPNAKNEKAPIKLMIGAVSYLKLGDDLLYSGFAFTLSTLRASGPPSHAPAFNALRA
ncbi:MAG: hypothetical protein QNK43_01985, partial [Amphritea sp.]|nr:hypothetical protein [Amphritea sp.]